MAAKSVTINNADDARKVAAEYGINWPTGAGRPPTVKLWNALADAKVTVKGDYLKEPKPRLIPAAPGQRDYDITREVVKTDSRNRKRTVNETIRVNATELRTLTNALGLRGAIGTSRIREALGKMAATGKIQWSPEDIENAVIAPVPVGSVATSVVPEKPKPVEVKPKADKTAKPAAKAPAKPRAPRKPKAVAKAVNEAPKAPEAPVIVEPVKEAPAETATETVSA